MDKLEYIPGDLVMTNGIPIGTKKGIVYQVTESNADKSAKVKDGNAFTELKGSVTLSNLKGKTIHDEGFLFCDCGAWVKDIVPIPLTPEILEKNGWSKGQIYFRHSHIPRIKLCTADGGISWSVSINDDIMGSYINYVHQLQHILFAFGIEEEMEV